MTNPGVIGQDAISVIAGINAQLLYEYMPPESPTLVINDGVSRVYLGTTSSVSPNNGVPLDPGTGIPWIAHANRTELYVVLDTGGTPGRVTVTSNADGWTPSPAAIAAEVAAELLLSGVPSVLLQDVLLTETTIGSGSTALIDVHAYASLLISGQGRHSNTAGSPPFFPQQWNLLITWYDQAKNPLFTQGFGCVTGERQSLELPINAYWISLNWQMGIPIFPIFYFFDIYVAGSNRAVGGPTLITPLVPRSFNFTASVGNPFVANVPVVLNPADGGSASIVGNGPATMIVSATITGNYSCSYMRQDGTLATINLFLQSVAANVIPEFQFVLPSTPLAPLFTPTAGATSGSAILEVSSSG